MRGDALRRFSCNLGLGFSLSLSRTINAINPCLSSQTCYNTHQVHLQYSCIDFWQTLRSLNSSVKEDISILCQWPFYSIFLIFGKY